MKRSSSGSSSRKTTPDPQNTASRKRGVESMDVKGLADKYASCYIIRINNMIITAYSGLIIVIHHAACVAGVGGQRALSEG